ncbi:MAG: lactate utilization protein [Phycisphaerales bacterium]|nr:lactate utilization protein [Phycisphaerales bacterium]
MSADDDLEMNDLGVDRVTFLGAVSRALGRSALQPPQGSPPAVDPRIVRVLGEGDLAGIFADRAAKCGMVVHQVREEVATSCIADLLIRLGARRVAMADELPLEGLGERLTTAGLQIAEWWASEGVEGFYETDAGITGVQGAIAETGTLVCCSGRERARGLSLVPPIHIAIVRRSDIYPDLIDYLPMLSGWPEEPLPSSVVFISGPSKTADIEGILITGVHGPREVHVILMG